MTMYPIRGILRRIRMLCQKTFRVLTPYNAKNAEGRNHQFVSLLWLLLIFLTGITLGANGYIDVRSRVPHEQISRHYKYAFSVLVFMETIYWIWLIFFRDRLRPTCEDLKWRLSQDLGGFICCSELPEYKKDHVQNHLLYGCTFMAIILSFYYLWILSRMILRTFCGIPVEGVHQNYVYAVAGDTIYTLALMLHTWFQMIVAFHHRKGSVGASLHKLSAIIWIISLNLTVYFQITMMEAVENKHYLQEIFSGTHHESHPFKSCFNESGVTLHTLEQHHHEWIQPLGYAIAVEFVLTLNTVFISLWYHGGQSVKGRRKRRESSAAKRRMSKKHEFMTVEEGERFQVGSPVRRKATPILDSVVEEGERFQIGSSAKQRSTHDFADNAEMRAPSPMRSSLKRRPMCVQGGNNSQPDKLQLNSREDNTASLTIEGMTTDSAITPSPDSEFTIEEEEELEEPLLPKQNDDWILSPETPDGGLTPDTDDLFAATPEPGSEVDDSSKCGYATLPFHNDLNDGNIVPREHGILKHVSHAVPESLDEKDTNSTGVLVTSASKSRLQASEPLIDDPEPSFPRKHSILPWRGSLRRQSSFDPHGTPTKKISQGSWMIQQFRRRSNFNWRRQSVKATKNPGNVPWLGAAMGLLFTAPLFVVSVWAYRKSTELAVPNSPAHGSLHAVGNVHSDSKEHHASLKAAHAVEDASFHTVDAGVFHYAKIYEAVTMASHVFMSILSVVALYIANHMKPSKHLHAHEQIDIILLLITLFGMMMLSSFAFSAILYPWRTDIPSEGRLKLIVGLEIITGATQVFLQTMLITKGFSTLSTRYDKHEMQIFRWKWTRRRMGKVIAEIYMVLTSYNFLMWVVHAFYERRVNSLFHHTVTQFYPREAWLVVTEITYPMSICYYFHSMICLLALMNKFATHWRG